jgi:hypothetical protein
MTGEQFAPVQAFEDDPAVHPEQPGLDDIDRLGAERAQRDGRDLVELRALRALLRVVEEEGARVDEGAGCCGRP